MSEHTSKISIGNNKPTKNENQELKGKLKPLLKRTVQALVLVISLQISTWVQEYKGIEEERINVFIFLVLTMFYLNPISELKDDLPGAPTNYSFILFIPVFMIIWPLSKIMNYYNVEIELGALLTDEGIIWGLLFAVIVSIIAYPLYNLTMYHYTNSIKWNESKVNQNFQIYRNIKTSHWNKKQKSSLNEIKANYLIIGQKDGMFQLQSNFVTELIEQKLQLGLLILTFLLSTEVFFSMLYGDSLFSYETLGIDLGKSSLYILMFIFNISFKRLFGRFFEVDKQEGAKSYFRKSPYQNWKEKSPGILRTLILSPHYTFYYFIYFTTAILVIGQFIISPISLISLFISPWYMTGITSQIEMIELWLTVIFLIYFALINVYIFLIIAYRFLKNELQPLKSTFLVKNIVYSIPVMNFLYIFTLFIPHYRFTGVYSDHVDLILISLLLISQFAILIVSIIKSKQKNEYYITMRTMIVLVTIIILTLIGLEMNSSRNDIAPLIYSMLIKSNIIAATLLSVILLYLGNANKIIKQLKDIDLIFGSILAISLLDPLILIIFPNLEDIVNPLYPTIYLLLPTSTLIVLWVVIFIFTLLLFVQFYKKYKMKMDKIERNDITSDLYDHLFFGNSKITKITKLRTTFE